MKRSLLLLPRDPMMFRDGKPFDAGLGARSIGWPMPSTIAGSIRTRLWGDREFNQQAVDRLREVHHTGPFLAALGEDGRWDVAFPAPADAAVYSSGRGAFQIVPLRPTAAGAYGEGTGCDLPAGLHPLVGAQAKKAAEDAPMFWTAESSLEWLEKTDFSSWLRTGEVVGYDRLPGQSRLHVQMELDRRNAAEGMLYRTASLEFDFDTEFRHHKEKRRKQRPAKALGIFSQVQADGDDWASTDGAGPLGGEQRTAVWSQTENLLPRAPEGLKDLKRVRVQLLTPGVFTKGWKPGWAEGGEPPGCEGLKLKLVAAAVGRRLAVSGFDMTLKEEKRYRPTRFLVPAGSVYFFEVERGDPAQLWLRPVSDGEPEQKDGFGIALTGGWEWR